MRSWWLLACMVGLGCGAVAPTPIDTTGIDDAGVMGDGSESENPNPIVTEPEPLLPPSVNMPPDTEWETVPVRGRGAKNGIVLVQSEDGTSLTTTTDSEGMYCIDVPLVINQRNRLTLRTQNTYGELSPMSSGEIQQTGEPPKIPEDKMSQNFATGGNYRGNMVAISGDPKFVNDGNAQTSFLAGHPVGYPGWMWIDLRMEARIKTIRVRSGSDCPLKHYAVFISNLSKPGNPPDGISVSTANWTKVSEIHQGTGDDTIPIQPQMVRTVSIRPVDLDCGVFGIAYRHKISEIEAWSEGPEPGSIPVKPTCYNSN